MEEFNTPMMKQYMQIKKDYQDCLLFFRMGDFYELFLEDAHIGAKVLDITLTGKAAGKDKRIPMAGVPFHAVDSYLAKLVKAGHKVAICEQMSEPDGKGIVDRQVIRIVTPGTVLDEKTLEKKENNYLISFFFDEKVLGIAVADLSTGQFQTTEFEINNLEQLILNELSRINPSECILHINHYNDPNILRILKKHKGLNIYCFQEWDNFARKSEQFLKKHFGVNSLAGFGIDNKEKALQSSAALLGYLQTTQKDTVSHIKNLSTYSTNEYVQLDRSTIMNLELFSTLREGEKKGSLLSVIDHTTTAFGGRMLREWVRKPLLQKEEILARQDAVEELLKKQKLRAVLQSHFEEIMDIERLIARLSVGIGNARDLVNLKNSLKNALLVKDIVSSTSSKKLQNCAQNIDSTVTKIVNLIETYILEEPSFDVKDGGIIRANVDKELDSLREIVNGGKTWITELEQQEKERTGIGSLKVRFNKVFGFYIEVSKSNVHLVPDNYQRKQTLVNGERFITPQLKEMEEKILSADELCGEIEYKIFSEVLQKILSEVKSIQKTAESIGTIDCLLSFAIISEKNSYCKPEIVTTGRITIKQGRHPVVESILHDRQFVPNDVVLNNEDQQLLIITGPNMAGKSVFIRQVAIIVLLAQMGSFVPAKEAKLSLVDRIFVRSGASDVITAGLSTFMVEMVETAQILHNTTEKSLIIMDEIGRGTSTYDGISIAWAVAEYLVTQKKKAAKTLFATHYHELQALEDKHPNKIKNFHMAIEEHKGEPIFLHTLISGGASHSHGVSVAKLAGIPEDVLTKAWEMLHSLENREQTISAEKINSKQEKSVVLEELKNLDVYNLTPLQALNKLAELKGKM